MRSPGECRGLFKLLLAFGLSGIVLAVMVPALAARGVELTHWMIWPVIIASMLLCLGGEIRSPSESTRLNPFLARDLRPVPNGRNANRWRDTRRQDDATTQRSSGVRRIPDRAFRQRLCRRDVLSSCSLPKALPR